MRASVQKRADGAVLGAHHDDFLAKHGTTKEFRHADFTALGDLAVTYGDHGATGRLFGCGIGVGRSPVDWYSHHLENTMPAFRDACSAIKSALDPHGVLAPGRYGIT